MRYTGRELTESMLKSCKSRKTYQFYRQNGHILPCLNTVRRLKSGLNCKRGLSEDGLKIMQEVLTKQDERDRFIILKFDEVFLNTNLRVGGAGQNFQIDGVSEPKYSDQPLNKRM